SGGGPARVDLVSGDALDESGAVDTLTGIENLVGSLGDDLLVGDDGANRLQGGVGADTLRGNGGADVFAYADRLEFGDTIRDFTSGSDVIELARAAVGAGTVAFDAGVLNLLDGDTTTLIAVIAGDTVAAADIQIV
ncbi:MAG: M10 family metallopeptidase C-terminal domain-containing protein, partial [Magnetospirillum sp.]|nr:M10 family metallopeptidase C-terminal domain-containing protein [Magnetospirillum sp.]